MTEVCEKLVTDPAVTESISDNDILDVLPTMTKEELVSVALEHGGYSTPSLNDTLYLHFKGYRRIENLEEYIGLKSLWLHSNGFGKIENISHLTELRCLFLQSNTLTRIENLKGLNSLVQLDLSENNITFIEGLSDLPRLTTINLSKNALKDASSILHLQECMALSSVDLSKNDLVGEDIIDCLAGIRKLANIKMTGNPVVSKVAFFRKKLIFASKTLLYLDRPVFDAERAAVEAWVAGGTEAEVKTKKEWHQMNKDKQRQMTQDFRDWQATVRIDRAPRYDVARIEKLDEELSSDEDINDTVKYCDEVKSAYLTGENLEGLPLLSNEPKSKIVTLFEGDSQPYNEVNSDPSLQKTVPLCAAKTEAEITDLINSNVAKLPNDDDAKDVESDFYKKKRIQDSIAIIKSFQSTVVKQISDAQLGWTLDMDTKLLKYAQKCAYDMKAVAAEMTQEFKEAMIEFDESTCDRRYNLLDLSVQHMVVPKVNVSSESTFSCTTKSLVSFLNEDGSRKSIDQLYHDSNSDLITPFSLPECNFLHDDEMNDMPLRTYDRHELWNMVKLSTEQKLDATN